ncbi:MAG TPA: serine/threonine-protein kinase [Ktedonobacteraceae bacterium]|nr:serine/threonine-protein kinase [Ktedonobacteraceae bacterium]
MRDGNDLVGKVLGTCTLERLIGRGGMGAVYLAQQVRPLRHVAVKVLLPNVMMNSEVYKAFLARFQREANLIAQLEHVNIMPIYEYGEQDGLPYLVMPYLTGGSLRDILARRGALSLHETMTYLDQAAAALDYAHAHGIIHRDLKPANFLLHADGRLVLADFGIARMVQDGVTDASTLTGTGMLVGTPDYMAPEMAHGEQVDQRADIYELGILLFQMLSGHVPFTGSTPLIVAVKHLQEPLPSLFQINPAIPPAVDVVVRKATAKRREDRYGSAHDLAQAFRAAITAPDYSWSEHARTTPVTSFPQPSAQDQIVLPGTQHRYNTPPGQYAIPTTPVPSTPAQSRASALGTEKVIFPESPPATPSIEEIAPEKRKSRVRAILFISLLILALFTGATFIGLKAAGILTTPQGMTPTPTPTSAQQARATIQQFYADINKGDYRDAYSLFGSKLQNGQTYDNFKSGFAHTKHDDIQFGTETANSNGTFNVPITIHATEDNVPGPGMHQSTYHITYLVGKVNGRWKILDGRVSS